ncbi:hypothetical protein BDP55DRAFT_195503 [Colletotrichum godetiae]|uniref:Uncharacterized protein n=1 Tax=Colletotrichum godetiae TaxID=1209918 RepID=A0AAJ0AIQ8_9PEZI|nr:uncharacterized protein BDP55DRAFT_195503 [Colletotrichum godetiae]KAK1673979.1 hypothetical protein BDP55DRAFT_195503 [Colletotrichum godetiae]
MVPPSPRHYTNMSQVSTKSTNSPCRRQLKPTSRKTGLRPPCTTDSGPTPYRPPAHLLSVLELNCCRLRHDRELRC